MKTKLIKVAKAGLVLPVLLAATVGPLHAQTNSYSSSFSGKWESGTNWSFGAPGSGQSIYITNSGTKTVTIDATTSGSFSNTMSISNLTLFGTSGAATNVLALAGAGTMVPFQIASTLTIGSSLSQGYVTISNSSLQIGSTVQLNRGIMTLNSGFLSASNGTFSIGTTSSGPGSLTVNDGYAQFGTVSIGTATSAFGSWTINGGTNSCQNNVTVGNTGNGTLSVNGGMLIVNNPSSGNLRLADNSTNSSGTLSISNGEVDANFIRVGSRGQGILNMSSGLLTASSSVIFGAAAGSSGSSLITGGTFIVASAGYDAVFEIRRGSFTNTGGIFQADNLLITNGGSMSLLTSNNFAIGSAAGASNTATISGGSTVTLLGAALGAGNDGTTSQGFGTGTITVSNAILTASTINLGSTAGGIGNLILQSNASVNVFSNLNVVSSSPSSTSSVFLYGGSLTSSSGLIQIGTTGKGLMTVSGATVTAQTMQLGSSNANSSGTLTMSNNSTLRITSLLSVNSTNSFDLPGINVVVDGTGSTLNIGDDSPGKMTVSSPTASQTWKNVNIGFKSTGTYLQSAGQTFVTNLVIVGNCVTNATGALGLVTLSGGTFYVTNSTHTAALVVRSGTFLLQSGATLVVDNLIMTNACAQFLNGGGTLTAAATNLDPNLDADGDGVSNGAEASAGTDPFNAVSYFHILSASVSGQDVSVTWSSVAGHHYVVQASNTKLANASFADVSTVISASGTQTVFRHVGGAAHPFGYYRVRLAP